jgi:hypothetical protein
MQLGFISTVRRRRPSVLERPLFAGYCRTLPETEAFTSAPLKRDYAG